MRILPVLAFAFLIAGSYQAPAAESSRFTAMKIRIGDNIVSILRKHGFSQAQREEVLRKAPGLGSLLLTTDMTYLVENGDGLALRVYDLSSEKAYRVWRKGTTAGADRYLPQWQTTVTRHEGKIRGSLMGNLTDAVPSNWVASRFMDAFILERDLADIPAGSKFAMAVEKKSENGVFIKYGEVLEASLTINGRTTRRDFVRFNGGGVFVNPSDMLSEKPFYSPVNYLRIASTFQPDRKHPITHRVQPHLGIDFELPQGAPVFAPKRGYVVRRGRTHAAGNFVVLRHPNGVETLYDHLSRLDPAARIGASIRAGQKIAEVGCTGYCTRPHLHFAVKIRGRMVNPATVTKLFPSQYEDSINSKIAAF